MKPNLLIIILLFSLLDLSLERKEVELYYASSTNQTINDIFYIYREFIVITRHFDDPSSCRVDIIHEKTDGSWTNLPARNISYFLINNTIPYDIWQYQIKWLSLGSPYQYGHNFAVKFTYGPEVYYDNNRFHNYYLKNNDGYFFNKNRNIKVQRASLTYDNAKNTSKVEGIFLVKNLEYLKDCFAYCAYTEKDENINHIFARGIFLTKNNRFGIEKWSFEAVIPGKVEYLLFFVTVIYHPKIEREQFDTNFEKYYILTPEIPFINHDNNNIATGEIKDNTEPKNRDSLLSLFTS